MPRAEICIFATVLISCFISFSGCAKMSAVNTLIELSRNEKLKAREIKQETENFYNVKRYITEGKIQKGITKEAASGKFGEPAAILSRNGSQEWVYKPGRASWFEGEKIYLYFNEGGALEKWECVDSDCAALNNGRHGNR
ncbi:MAG: hypothetical protein ABIH40_02315 [Candidatus Omnitrophota bacterium]